MIVVVSSSTCVKILLQVCSNVLLSVIPWWGCSQSLLGSGWMGLIHSLPAAHCAAFCRHFALYTCLSSCWHLSFCRPAPLCQLGKKPLLLYRSIVLYLMLVWAKFASPLLFQSKIETKMRDGFTASAKSSLFCASCSLCHGLEVPTQESRTDRQTDRDRHSGQTGRGVI